VENGVAREILLAHEGFGALIALEGLGALVHILDVH